MGTFFLSLLISNSTLFVPHLTGEPSIATRTDALLHSKSSILAGQAIFGNIKCHITDTTNKNILIMTASAKNMSKHFRAFKITQI